MRFGSCYALQGVHTLMYDIATYVNSLIPRLLHLNISFHWKYQKTKILDPVYHASTMHQFQLFPLFQTKTAFPR